MREFAFVLTEAGGLDQVAGEEANTTGKPLDAAVHRPKRSLQ